MIIRGHSGEDIKRMFWRKRYKILAVAILIFTAVTLTGCGQKKITPTTVPLKALDKFWDTLGGKTTDLSEKDK